MRKFSVSFMLFCYLLSNTEAYQLFKIPVILEHYREHKMGNRQLTFLKFLDQHYLHGSPHDADYERDMQLPFKIINHPINTVPVSLPAILYTELTLVPRGTGFVYPSRPGRALPQQFSPSVFQPPRA